VGVRQAEAVSVSLVFVGVTGGHLSVVVVVVADVDVFVAFGMSTGADVACCTSAVLAVIVGTTAAVEVMGGLVCCTLVAEPQVPFPGLALPALGGGCVCCCRFTLSLKHLLHIPS